MERRGGVTFLLEPELSDCQPRSSSALRYTCPLLFIISTGFCPGNNTGGKDIKLRSMVVLL